MLDIDEYIQVMQPQKKQLRQILTDFQHNPNMSLYGGIAATNFFFGAKGRKGGLPKSPILVEEYTWRAPNEDIERQKCIVRPTKIDLYAVHKSFTQKMYIAEEIRLSHYKKPQNGVYHSQNQNQVVDTSMRDQFSDKIKAQMKIKQLNDTERLG